MIVSNSYRDRLLGIGVISARTRSTVVEGRSHPDSGLPYKAVTDEHGNTVTEHGQPGSGVTDRQDVLLRPETIKVKWGPS